MDSEASDDDQEYKEVIYRQCFFGDVTSEVLGAHIGTAEDQFKDSEEQGNANINAGPDRCFSQVRNVGLAYVEEIIEGQQAENEDHSEGPN